MQKEPPLHRYLVGEELDLIFCSQKEVRKVVHMVNKEGASLDDVLDYLNRPVYEVLFLLLDLARTKRIKRLLIDINT